jgi:succinoglycan exporter
MSITARTVLSGTVWMTGSRILSLGLRALVVPILARLLTPEDFGLVGASLAILLLFALLAAEGLPSALIAVARPRHEDPDLWNSVFWASLALCVVLIVPIVIFAAPLATLLGEPASAPVLVGLSGVLLCQFVNTFLRAEITKELQFQTQATVDVAASVVAAAAAIVAALAGAGVWALVLQHYLLQIGGAVGLWYRTRFVPTGRIRPRALAALVPFAFANLIGNLCDWVAMRGPVLVLVRMVGTPAAGAWTVSRQFVNIPQQAARSGFMFVLFPAFSRLQNEPARLAEALRSSIHASSLTQAPLLFGLWAVAEPAMAVIFGPQWTATWPILALIALGTALQAPTAALRPYFQGTARSDRLWRHGLERALATLLGVGVGAFFGDAAGAALGFCVMMGLVTPVQLVDGFRIAGLPPLATCLYVLRPLAWSGLMALGVRFAVDAALAEGVSAFATLALGVLSGGIVFLALVVLFERQTLRYVRELRGLERKPA